MSVETIKQAAIEAVLGHYKLSTLGNTLMNLGHAGANAFRAGRSVLGKAPLSTAANVAGKTFMASGGGQAAGRLAAGGATLAGGAYLAGRGLGAGQQAAQQPQQPQFGQYQMR